MKAWAEFKICQVATALDSNSDWSPTAAVVSYQITMKSAVVKIINRNPSTKLPNSCSVIAIHQSGELSNFRFPPFSAWPDWSPLSPERADLGCRLHRQQSWLRLWLSSGWTTEPFQILARKKIKKRTKERKQISIAHVWKESLDTIPSSPKLPTCCLDVLLCVIQRVCADGEERMDTRDDVRYVAKVRRPCQTS